MFSKSLIITTISIVFSFYYPVQDHTQIEKQGHSLNQYLIGSEYFPTNTSLKLYYESSMGEAIATTKKNGKEYVLDLRNDDFNFTQTVYFQNDTVYLTQLDQRVDVFLFISSKISVTYSRPYLRFPFPLRKDDDWAWNGVEFIDKKIPIVLWSLEKYLERK